MEDSVLTVFINPLKNQVETDTIYPSGVPSEMKFVFENIGSNNSISETEIILARGRRVIQINTYSTTEKISFSTSKIRWYGDRIVVFARLEKNNVLDSLIKQIYIIPKPILEEIQKREQQRINDSINQAKSQIAAVEYYQNRFDRLKEPQENLTERDRRKIAKLYKKTRTPDGVKIKIDTALNTFIDQTEINNIHWLEYLYFLLEDSTTEQYLYNLPDTTIWEKEFYRENKGTYVYDYHYLRHPGFRYYPVVGITYEQAQNYCIWRANMVNDGLKKQNKNKDYEIIVHYRLPTEEEWEYAAIKDDLNYQFGGYSVRRRYTEKEKRKIYRSAKNYVDSTRTLEQVELDMKNYFASDTSYKRMFKYKSEHQQPYFFKEREVFEVLKTNWVFAYKPTRHFEVYNIFGNVAEMTSEKGISKGGSFAHTLEECAADRVQKYDAPKAWLGFRCVAEVVVRKKEN